MKVVKDGTKDSYTVWSGRCNQCNSEMEEVEGKLAATPGLGHVNAKCPICGSKFQLYKKVIR